MRRGVSNFKFTVPIEVDKICALSYNNNKMLYSDGQKVFSMERSEWREPGRDVDIIDGYPGFIAGVVDELSYVEITIESVSSYAWSW